MPAPYKHFNDEDVKKYGFEEVVRDQDVLFKDHPTASGTSPKVDNLTYNQIPFPDTELVRKVKEFVKNELPEPTLNHSMRVYVWGYAVWKTHFPHWTVDLETWFLTCLFHDIGTAEKFLLTTKMSFEFKGGIVAREFILKNNGVEDQADSVCESIIRHQDVFVKGGYITTLGQLIQIATLLDNAGKQANLISIPLLESTIAAYPRLKWSSCFSKVIYTELNAKPWCHTSTFESPQYKEGDKSNFAGAVEANDYMNKFE